MEPIYIIGTGAIGKALAVFLHAAHRQVVLVRGREMEGSDAIETIQVATPDGAVLQASFEIKRLSQFSRLSGTVVLTTKSFGNEQLAPVLKARIADNPLVILQNGLGVEQPFIEQGIASLYRCVLLATSQFADDGTVVFRPVTASPVGPLLGPEHKAKDIVAQLHTPWFPFRVEPNLDRFIWKKAIANCVFNSICVLLEVDNGIFHRSEAARAMALRVVGECLTVANKLEIDLTEAEVWDNILAISRASDGQLISTLQDIRNKRLTEIDTLNFEVVRQAERLGVLAHVTETKLLGELVLLKSKIAIGSAFN